MTTFTCPSAALHDLLLLTNKAPNRVISPLDSQGKCRVSILDGLPEGEFLIFRPVKGSLIAIREDIVSPGLHIYPSINFHASQGIGKLFDTLMDMRRPLRVIPPKKG